MHGVFIWRKPASRSGRGTRAPSPGRSATRRFRFTLALVLALAPVVALAEGHPNPAAGRPGASARMPTSRSLAGTWRRLPAAPIPAPDIRTSVWTGRQMLVFGRAHLTPVKAVNVAAAYNPSANTWRRLAPPPGLTGSFQGRYSAVWTGKEMLVWGPFTTEAFDPIANQWRRLPSSPTYAHHAGGIVVWTGREMVGWGGGCCGDAFNDGAAYSPDTNTWRKLARPPLAGSQSPTGAWTGRELIIFGDYFDPDGRPLRPRAAAYDPTTDRWRRIAPLPAPRFGASAVWDGREVLVVGGGLASRGGRPPALALIGFAYNPTTNRWRRLPSMEAGRAGSAAVWAGKQLLVWGGQTGPLGGENFVIPPHGLAYDPKANRWSPLPRAPLLGRLDPTAVWTGRAMIVWGGHKPATPLGTGETFFADEAAFTPVPP